MRTDSAPARARAERLTLKDHEERIAVIGSWEWTADTGELIWSDNHFRLFGLEPGAIVPSVEFVLSQIHPADRERVAKSLDSMHEGSGPLDYRIVRDDDVVRHFRATVALVTDDERPRRVVGSVQDVTGQNSIARKLAAHAAVSKALGEWQEFDQGTASLLADLATAMNLPFGVLWVPRDSHLKARRVWHVPSQPLAALAAATRDWQPGPGAPRLGHAWMTCEPVISNEPALGGTVARKAAMAAAGIGATVAIPAVAVGETVAILEFLSLEPIEPSDGLLSSLSGIGHEIGYFLGRRRGELDAPLLTRRETEVLQLAARAFSAVDIAKEMKVSPATVKRHFERAYARLGVSDRAAAVGRAMRQGLIT